MLATKRHAEHGSEAVLVRPEPDHARPAPQSVNRNEGYQTRPKLHDVVLMKNEPGRDPCYSKKKNQTI